MIKSKNLLKEDYNSCLSIADKDAKKFKDEWLHNDDITMADILISLGYESADDVRFYKEFNDGNAIVFDFAPYEDEYDYIYYYVIDEDNNIPKGYTKTRLVINDDEKFELNPDNPKGSWNKKVVPHNTYYDDYADDFYDDPVYNRQLGEDWTVSDSGERVYVDDNQIDYEYYVDDGTQEYYFDTYDEAVAFADENNIDLIRRSYRFPDYKNDYKWVRDEQGKFNAEDEPMVPMRDGSWKKQVSTSKQNNLKESSYDPFIDWETNKKARKEVLDWWADVEEWNAANDYPYNIENDTDDVGAMFTAIYDMANTLRKDAPELFKRGKAINNRYAVSQIKESVLKEDKTYSVGTIPYMGREFIKAVISTSNDSGIVRRGKKLLSNLEDDSYYKTYMNSKDKHQNVGTLDNQIVNFVAEVLDDIQDRQLKKQGERIINLYNGNSLTEDNEPLKEDFWSLHRDLIKDKKITEVKAGELLYVQNGMNDVCVGEYLGDAHIVTMNWDQPGKRYKSYEYSVRVVLPLSKRHRVGSITNGFTSGYVSVFEGTIEDIKNESLNEDTVKQNKKWVNKGKEGTHGKFRTKKEADAQRKAMFANGYKEGLEEMEERRKPVKKTFNSFIDALNFLNDNKKSLSKQNIIDINIVPPQNEWQKEKRIENKYRCYLNKFSDWYLFSFEEPNKGNTFSKQTHTMSQLISYVIDFLKPYAEKETYKEGLKEARTKKPNPEDIKVLDSGYASSKEEFQKIKKEQIAKYKKDYPNVKCELVHSDTKGLKAWETYCLKTDLKEDISTYTGEPSDDEIDNFYFKNPDKNIVKHYMFDCFDLHTGDQNIFFIGEGGNEAEARLNAHIPGRYEINDVYPGIYSKEGEHDMDYIQSQTSFLKEDIVDDSFARRIRKTACPHCSNLTLNLIDYDHVICDECGSEYIADEGFKGIKLTPVTNESLKESNNTSDISNIINAIRTKSISKGGVLEVGDYKHGWLAQIQNPGSGTVDIKRNSFKETSGAWGRIWKDGEFVKEFEGPLNVVRNDMIKFLINVKDTDYDKSSAEDLHEDGFDIEDDEYDTEFYKGDDGCFYKEICHKVVNDYDGFTTDYTGYMKITPNGKENEVSFVFVFGDNELYRPEDGNYDYECSNVDEAFEWFDNYNGFDEDDDLELTSDDMNAGQWYESLKEDITDRWAVVDDASGDIIDVFSSKDEAIEAATENQNLKDDGMFIRYKGPFVVEPYYEPLKEDTEKLRAIIKGEERPQVFVGGKVKPVRDTIDWFTCSSREEMCNELRDIYSDDYYDDCVVEVSGNGWTVDGKEFLAQNESINEAFVDGDDIEAFRKLKLGDEVKFSTDEMSLPPEVGEFFRVGPYTGTCIKSNDGYVVMKVENSSFGFNESLNEAKDMAQKLVDAGILTKEQANHTFNDKQIEDIYNKHFDKNGRQNRRSRYGKIKESSEKLSYQDKADIKKKIDTTDDSELIAAYVNSKTNKNNNNQTQFNESIDGLSNSATDIVMGLYDKFPEINFIDERDLDNNQVGLIFEGASKVDAVDLGTYLDGLYVWYKIKGDKLLVKADEDANYLDEADNDLYDPYDAIDAEYNEEDV